MKILQVGTRFRLTGLIGGGVNRQQQSSSSRGVGNQLHPTNKLVKEKSESFVFTRLLHLDLIGFAPNRPVGWHR